MHTLKSQQQTCIHLMTVDGLTVVQVSQSHGIPPRTLRYWRFHFELYGETPCETHEFKKTLGPRIYTRVATPDVKDSLRVIVSGQPWLYLDEIQDLLLTQTGVLLSDTTISSIMINEFNWSLKVAQYSARERDELMRGEHQANLFNLTGNK